MQADLVGRRFVADGPDPLWCTDITKHPTAEGKVYCAAVLDVFSHVLVGCQSRGAAIESLPSTTS